MNTATMTATATEARTEPRTASTPDALLQSLVDCEDVDHLADSVELLTATSLRQLCRMIRHASRRAAGRSARNFDRMEYACLAELYRIQVALAGA